LLLLWVASLWRWPDHLLLKCHLLLHLRWELLAWWHPEARPWIANLLWEMHLRGLSIELLLLLYLTRRRPDLSRVALELLRWTVSPTHVLLLAIGRPDYWCSSKRWLPVLIREHIAHSDWVAVADVLCHGGLAFALNLWLLGVVDGLN
jgi:hypothetical protein